MATYHLQIVSPDGLLFDGEAEYLLVRSSTGDMGIQKGHAATITPMGTGVCLVREAGGEGRYAMCSGGLLYVDANIVRALPQIFEWADAIDVERAKKSLEETTRKLEELRASGRGDIGPAEETLKNRIDRETARVRAVEAAGKPV